MDLHFHREKAFPPVVVRDRPLRMSICEDKCVIMPTDALAKLVKQNMAMAALYARHHASEADFNSKGGLHVAAADPPQWGSGMWVFYDGLFS